MGFIDFILNLAGLLLWLNWRAIGFAQRAQPPRVSLVGTLKRPEVKEGSRWTSLLGLLGLLLVRALFYRQIGSGVDWTPSLDLGAISLHFRSDYLSRMILFSGVSFFLMLGTIYSWLLLLSVVNRSVPDSDFFQKLVRLHLGRVERWLAPIKLLLPVATATVLWVALRGTVLGMGMIPGNVSTAHLWQEAFLIGTATFFAWKTLILGFLGLYVLSSYVYLGNHPFWNFVSETSRNMLKPLRVVPLQFGKFDLAPLIGIGVVVVLAHFGARELTWFYRQLPLKWPLS
jgi:uncharacterized protein YggT (Ycf19 family)